MIPAVVYPSETSSGFCVIESLSRAKIPVIGLNHRKTYHSLSNRFKDLLCPNPAKEQEAFVDFLIQLGKKLGKAVLFVASDISVFLVLRHKTSLEKYYFYPFLEQDRILFGFDKWAMFQVAGRLGIPTPHTVQGLFSDPEARRRLADFHYLALIKPVARFLIKGNAAEKVDEFYDRYKSSKALVAHNYEELLCLGDEVSSEGFEVLVQEQIPGQPSSLHETKFYVDQSGNIADMVSTRKTRQFPADIGISTFGEMTLCSIIEDYTRKFIEEIGYKGIGEMEFRYDERDGQYKLLELNPRPNHWMSLLLFTGHDLVLRQYEDYTGLFVKHFKMSEKKIKWFHLEGEIYYWAVYGLDRSSPYYVSWIKQVWSLLAYPTVEAFFSWRDPLFSSAYLLKCLGIILRKLIQVAIVSLTGIYFSRKDGIHFARKRILWASFSTRAEKVREIK